MSFPGQSWFTDHGGNVTVIAAFGMLGLVMSAGIATDFVVASRERAALQAAADAAAIDGAKEIPLALEDPAHIDLVAENFALVNLGIGLAAGAGGSRPGTGATAPSGSSAGGGSASGLASGPNLKTEVDYDQGFVTVFIEGQRTSYF